MSRRSISWSAALRDLKDDRIVRAEIREEGLRTVSHLRGGVSTPMSAWRGRSAKRYVVTVRPLASDPVDLTNAVALAVVRNAGGQAAIVRATFGLDASGARTWLASMTAAGADEIHVHRLAQGPAEQQAAILDLTERAQGAA